MYMTSIIGVHSPTAFKHHKGAACGLSACGLALAQVSFRFFMVSWFGTGVERLCENEATNQTLGRCWLGV